MKKSTVSYFETAPTWFDKHKIPLLPSSHGESFDTNVNEGVKAFLEIAKSEKPFSLVRLGDSEVYFAGAGVIPVHKMNALDEYIYFSGADRDSFSLRQELFHSIRTADLLGVQQNWVPVTQATFILLSLLGLETPLPNGIEVHSAYALLTKGILFDFIEGKKVALIGHHAPQVAEALKNAQLLDTYSFLKPLKDPVVIQTPERGLGASSQYQEIVKQALAADYEVALISFGTFAKTLATKIKESGRTALDVGFCFDALIGNPDRENRPVLRDVSWSEQF